MASNQIGWPLNHGPGKKAEVLVFKSPARSVWPFSQLHDTSFSQKSRRKMQDYFRSNLELIAVDPSSVVVDQSS